MTNRDWLYETDRTEEFWDDYFCAQSSIDEVRYFRTKWGVDSTHDAVMKWYSEEHVEFVPKRITNYDRLVSTNKLAEFLRDVSRRYSSPNWTYTDERNFKKLWNFNLIDATMDDIARWLNVEVEDD